MQPEWASDLGNRKAANIRRLEADVVATGNIGCLAQISGKLDDEDPPVVHTVELLNWASGGKRPDGI